MEKINVTLTANFSETKCPNNFQWWAITGEEKPVMAGTYRCRTCRYHVVLPLAGKNTFGCTFIKEIK